jgi:hypothetical protein
MTTRHTVFATLVLVMALLGGGRVGAQESPEGKPIVLPASDAKVTGALKIQGKSETATIHFWNNTNDAISWVWVGAKPGNYRVELNYSLDPKMTGGKILFRAGDQQLIAPAPVTGKWSDFHTFELGVVQVGQGGDIPVKLQAAQLPQVPGAALPDVGWLSFTATKAPATSNPVVQPGHGRD